MNTAACKSFGRILRVWVIAVIVASTVLVSSTAPVKAATITLYVDTTDDYNFGSNGASACADPNPGAIDCSLRGAVARANFQLDDPDPGNNGDVFVINIVAQVPIGTFDLDKDSGSGNVYNENGNMKGDLDIRGNVVIVGAADPDNIIIDALSLDRALDITSGANVTISGVTIRNGFPRGTTIVSSKTYPEPGGGIRNQGTLTINNSVVSGNQTNDGATSPGGYGGGIYNSGSLTASDLIVQDNFTGNGNGIGAFEGGGGGGIFNDSSGTLNLSFSNIIHNHTGVGGISYFGGSGGGLYNNKHAVLNTVNFDHNYTGDGTSGIPQGGGGGDGGAIFNNEGGDLYITSGNYTDNQTGKGALGQNTTGSGGVGGPGGKGGAIANSGSILSFVNATFERNATGAGGDCSINAAGALGLAGNGGLGGALFNSQYGHIGDGTATAITFIMDTNYTGAGGKCDGNGIGGHGGGLYNEGNMISPLQVEIRNNSTGAGGAALASHIEGGDGGDGGGIYNAGLIRYQGSGFQLGIDHAIISGNHTGMGGKGGSTPGTIGGNGGNGGGIYNRGTIAAIRFTTLEGNYTANGYGTRLASDPDEAGNGGNGGAIYNSGTVTELSYSLLKGNSTGNGGEANSTSVNGLGGNGGNGGAIALTDEGRLSMLFNSTVTLNTTGTGGRGSTHNPYGEGGNGAGIYSTGVTTIDVRMSTIVYNATQRNTNVTPNNAGHGGGIYVNTAGHPPTPGFNVVGSIISENQRAAAHSDCARTLSSDLQSLGFNVIRNPIDDFTVDQAGYKCTEFTNSADKFGPDITAADPKISALTANAYYVPDFDVNDPSVNSPAIDLVPASIYVSGVGNVYLCGVVDNQSASVIDQISHHRPLGIKCDAGSIEIGGVAYPYNIFLSIINKE